MGACSWDPTLVRRVLMAGTGNITTAYVYAICMLLLELAHAWKSTDARHGERPRPRRIIRKSLRSPSRSQLRYLRTPEEPKIGAFVANFKGKQPSGSDKWLWNRLKGSGLGRTQLRQRIGKPQAVPERYARETRRSARGEPPWNAEALLLIDGHYRKFNKKASLLWITWIAFCVDVA